jgi:hypothetical protein
MIRPPNTKRDPASVGDPIQDPAPKTRATAGAHCKKNRFYKPLAKRIRRAGFVYRQIARERSVAIYEKKWSGCSEPSVCYEVIWIRRREGFQIDGRSIPPAEIYARSEQWGESGWTFCDKDAAFVKLRVLRELAMTRHGPTLPQFVRDLLASPPPRGGGLNNWFYRVARVLHPYRDSAEIIKLLKAATAGEPVKHGEIERAVEHSKAKAWKRGQQSPQQSTKASAWPNLNLEQREAVIASGLGLVDLWENSPMRFEGNKSHAEEIIDALFPENPLLCAGRTHWDFDTRSREAWRGKFAALSLIVPNPMTARIGRTRDGKESAHTLETTAPRRFLVVEQDAGSIDEQSAVLLHLAERAPLAIAIHSGSKSIHGWFYCAGQTEERLRGFMQYAVSLGADRATWTRSQFVRMPDGTRDNGERQTIYFFNPEVVK